MDSFTEKFETSNRALYETLDYSSWHTNPSDDFICHQKTYDDIRWQQMTSDDNRWHQKTEFILQKPWMETGICPRAVWMHEWTEVYFLQAVPIYTHHDVDMTLWCTIFPTPKIDLKSGVNISFYSQINHLGKVSYFWRYREEFPQIRIHA